MNSTTNLTYAEQKKRGIRHPRAKCRVCTVSYSLREDDTLRRHGPRAAPPCSGSRRPPLGAPEGE